VAALIKGLVDGWARIVGDANLPKPADWTTWQKQAKAFSAALEASNCTDPGDAIIHFKDKAANLVRDLKEALKSQARDDAVKKKIAELLDAGNYMQAISEIAAANPRGASGAKEGRVAGATPAARGETAVEPTFPVVQFAPLAANFPAGVV